MRESIIGTFFEKDDGYGYEVDEGDVLVQTGYSCVTGIKDDYFVFNNPVGPENFLQFDLSGKEDLLMKPATESEATHINMYEPEFPSGSLPTREIIKGSYKRHVTAYKLKIGELPLPLSKTNFEIKSGDFLAIEDYYSGVNKYSGTLDEKQTVIAIESMPANAGGYILAELTTDKIPLKG